MQKIDKIRLKGKPLRELNELIYERDYRHCCICETYIEEGTKFHHEPTKGQGGQDVINGGLMLCGRCHGERHFGSETQDYRERCEEYLRRLYGGDTILPEVAIW